MGFYIGKTTARDFIRDISRTLTQRGNKEEDNWELVLPNDVSEITDRAVLKTNPEIKSLWINDEQHLIEGSTVDLEYDLVEGNQPSIKLIDLNDPLNLIKLKENVDYTIDGKTITLLKDLTSQYISVDYERIYDGEETFYVEFKRPDKDGWDEELLERQDINLIFLIDPVSDTDYYKDIERVVDGLPDTIDNVSLGLAIRGAGGDGYLKLNFLGDSTTWNKFELMEELSKALEELEDPTFSKSLYKTASDMIDDYFIPEYKENHLIMLTDGVEGGAPEELAELKSKLRGSPNYRLNIAYNKSRLPKPTITC